MPAAHRWSRLASGFVKAAFTIPPRLAGAPWVAVVLADLPRELPPVPVISGMGVHADRDVALSIAAAEAVERYAVLFHHARGTVPAVVGTTGRPVGTAVAGTRGTALRRATSECLERLALEKLASESVAAESVVRDTSWPAGVAASGLGRAIGVAGLTAEAYQSMVLTGWWLSVIVLIDPDGSPVAVGSAAAGSAQRAGARAAREAYGLWVSSADSLRSPVTGADRRLLTQLRTGATTSHRLPAPLLASPPASSVADIGTRLSDESGLYAVRVAVDEPSPDR